MHWRISIEFISLLANFNSIFYAFNIANFFETQLNYMTAYGTFIISGARLPRRALFRFYYMSASTQRTNVHFIKFSLSALIDRQQNNVKLSCKLE